MPCKASVSTRGSPSASNTLVAPDLREAMLRPIPSIPVPVPSPCLEVSPLRLLGCIPKRVRLYRCANLSLNIFASATRAGVRLARTASDDVKRT